MPFEVEKILMDEKKLDFFEAFDLINKIERAEKPEIEKIPILIKYATEFYERLDLDMEREKIDGWVFDEENQIWKREKISVEKMIEMAKLAYEKYNEKKALDNMADAYYFYKNRYDKFLNIYKPFYNYTFKLLANVNDAVEIIRKGKEEQIKKLESEKLIEEQEKKIDFLNGEHKRIRGVLKKTNDNIELQLIGVKKYADWIRLLTDKTLFSREDEIRIVLFLLLKGESNRAEIGTMLRIPDTSTTKLLANLHMKGALMKQTIAKRVIIYSLSTDFVERRIQESKKDGSERVENIMQQVADFRKEQDLLTEKERDENEEN